MDGQQPRAAWLWRGFLGLAVLAGVIAIAFIEVGRRGDAAGWFAVAAIWLVLGMWLRTRHGRSR